MMPDRRAACAGRRTAGIARGTSREAMSFEQARGEIRSCSGSQLDPEVVRALCEVLARSRVLDAA
jgi:response regulator RpfG family c-di-GMP phosphodiesterase